LTLPAALFYICGRMIFEDRFTVRAPVEEVWAFLRDPEQVGRCIPGTESIEVVDDTHYRVVAGAKVGFFSVSFAMNVTVTEIEEPRRLVSIAEGMDARLKERVKLTSALTLEPRDATTTEVGYRIDLTIFGKLAALGFGVIKGKAKQMAGDFATSIRTRLEATG
jgi:carbon monoxide dehydrogenase subunit G